MVLIVEALTPEFGEKFWEFIVDGKYRNKATNGSNPQFYRFDKLEDDEFPKMIELFCRSDFKLKMQRNYSNCGQPYAKINQLMPEGKNLHRLTKPEKPRKTKKCEVIQQ